MKYKCYICNIDTDTEAPEVELELPFVPFVGLDIWGETAWNVQWVAWHHEAQDFTLGCRKRE